jgi:hypothetical protein
MTDITIPLPGVARPVIGFSSSQLYVLLFVLFSILAAINISLVASKTDRDCETKQGPFSSGFNEGFQTNTCTCYPYFHFAEACPTPANLIPPELVPAL